MNNKRIQEIVEATGLDPDDILRTQSLLSQYFDRDEQKRFQMEGPLGGGVSGITWKLKYTPPNQGSASAAVPITQRLALKTEREYTFGGESSGGSRAGAPGGSGYRNVGSDGFEQGGKDIESRLSQGAPQDSEFVNIGLDGSEYSSERAASSDIEDGRVESMLPQEKRYLEFLRWAKHIVHSLSISDDPLKKIYPGIKPHHMENDHWVFMEYLQNGTLEKLVTRAAARDAPLPNRLLWRFFLCLIRMCIGMGWPPTQGVEGRPVTETAVGRPHGGLIHGDMHDKNIMFGDFDGPNDTEREHTLAPIMKLIDLGFMRHVLNERNNLQDAVANNIFDIGIVMVELVALDNGNVTVSIYPSEEDARPFDFWPDGPQVLTNGTILLPAPYGGEVPFPTLDPLLRSLICRCLATRGDDRPSAPELAATVINAISERDEAYYAELGLTGESDAYIRDLIQATIFDAN